MPSPDLYLIQAWKCQWDFRPGATNVPSSGRRRDHRWLIRSTRFWLSRRFTVLGWKESLPANLFLRLRQPGAAPDSIEPAGGHSSISSALTRPLRG